MEAPETKFFPQNSVSQGLIAHKIKMDEALADV